jgi:hypothetical protein
MAISTRRKGQAATPTGAKPKRRPAPARKSAESAHTITMDLDDFVDTLSRHRRDDEGRWFGDDEVSRNHGEQCERDELLIFGRFQQHSALTEFYETDENFFDCMARGISPDLNAAIDRKYDGQRRLWELMYMEPPARREAVSKAPYRDLYVAELMLLQCAKLLPDHLESAEEMALVALSIAEQPFPGEEERAEEVRTNVFCTQAEVLRLRWDFTQAEQKLLIALGLMVGPPESLSRARVAQTLAAVWEEQGRLAEATAMLLHAASLYEKLDYFGKRSECLARVGFLCLAQNDPGRAMAHFLQLCAGYADGFGPGAKPGPSLATWLDLGQAACLAAAGLVEPARELLKQNRPVRRLIYYRDPTLPYEWLECKIAIRLGDLEETVPRLEALLRWFVNRKSLFEACLCAVDLAWAYAKRGEAQQRLPALLGEVARLPQATQHVWALGALWKFRDALEQGAGPESAAWQASQVLRRRDRCLAGLGRVP